jgi:hypothetical protein
VHETGFMQFHAVQRIFANRAVFSEPWIFYETKKGSNENQLSLD